MEFNIDDINILIPKAVSTLQGIMNLYSKKSRGQVVTPQEYVDLFKNLRREDFKMALNILSAVNKKPHANVASFLNQGSYTSNYTLPGQTPGQSALHVIKAMVKTLVSENPVPAQEIIKLLDLKDENVKREFKKEYEQSLKEIKNFYAQKNEASSRLNMNLYLWARIGQVLFFGGIVLIIIIILRKIYEFLVDITDDIRYRIMEWIKPSNSRYYLKIMHFMKKFSKKKSHHHDSDQSPSSRRHRHGNKSKISKENDGVVININKSQNKNYQWRSMVPGLWGKKNKGSSSSTSEESKKNDRGEGSDGGDGGEWGDGNEGEPGSGDESEDMDMDNSEQKDQ